MNRNPRFALTALASALLAAPAVHAADASSAMEFFDGVTVGGWVAGSYVHRIDESDDDNLSTTYFSHPDANTFELDQAWLSLDKAPEPGGAGFHLDYVYGKIAQQQGGDDDSGLIYSAYGSYMTTGGVRFDAGRLTTLLGAEVLQTGANMNVTRGIVYSLQPITHTGVIASGSLGSGGAGWAFGVVNDIYDDTFSDASSSKAVTGRLNWTGDGTYAGLSVIYEGQTAGCAPQGDCSLAIVDLLVTHTVTDDLSVWVNFDYLSTDGDDLATDGSAYGIAAAGRLALSESTGVALRFELVNQDEDFLGAADDLQTFSITGTVDHALTDSLKIRGELRYDDSDEPTIFGYADSAGGFSEDSQVTGLIELIYTIN